jgi:hypothetical protein
MSSEIYDNLKLNKAAALDERLNPVATYNSLPPTTSPFLYEGAVIYVKDQTADYRLTMVNAVLKWEKQTGGRSGGSGSSTKVQGVITIASTETMLDLSNVSPDIATCDSVLINIQGISSSAEIIKIKNFPVGKEIIFYSQLNKSIKFKHKDFNTASTEDIVLEHGYDLEIIGRNIGNDMLLLERNSDAIVQKGATQFVRSTDWANTVITLNVENSLDSNAINKGLSAYQGKVLNTTKQSKLTVTNTDRAVIADINTESASLTIKPYNKQQISVNWTTALLTAAYTDIKTMLTTLPSLSTIWEDRYVDMTPGNGSNFNQPTNFGVWMLPAGLSPSLTSSWFQIEKPENLTLVTRVLPRNAIAGGTSDFALTFRNVNAVNLIGSFINSAGDLDTYIEFDNALPGSFSSYSFKPRYTASRDVYEIELTVNCANSSITHVPLRLNLFSLSTGLPVGSSIAFNISAPPNSTLVDSCWSDYNGRPAATDDPSTAGTRFKLTTKATIKFGGSGINNTAFCAILSSSVAGFNSSSISVLDGSLIIKKIG